MLIGRTAVSSPDQGRMESRFGWCIISESVGAERQWTKSTYTAQHSTVWYSIASVVSRRYGALAVLPPDGQSWGWARLGDDRLHCPAPSVWSRARLANQAAGPWIHGAAVLYCTPAKYTTLQYGSIGIWLAQTQAQSGVAAAAPSQHIIGQQLRERLPEVDMPPAPTPTPAPVPALSSLPPLNTPISSPLAHTATGSARGHDWGAPAGPMQHLQLKHLAAALAEVTQSTAGPVSEIAAISAPAAARHMPPPQPCNPQTVCVHWLSAHHHHPLPNATSRLACRATFGVGTCAIAADCVKVAHGCSLARVGPCWS